MVLTIDKQSKITINHVFDCHLFQVGGQMAIENSVSGYFLSTFVNSINDVDCCQSGVMLLVMC